MRKISYTGGVDGLINRIIRELFVGVSMFTTILLLFEIVIMNFFLPFPLPQVTYGLLIAATVLYIACELTQEKE